MDLYDQLEHQHREINLQLDQFTTDLSAGNDFDPVVVIKQLEDFSTLLFSHFTLEERIFSQMILDQGCTIGRRNQVLDSMGDIQRVIATFVRLIRKWWMRERDEIDQQQFRTEALQNLETIRDCMRSEESDIYAYCESCIRAVDLEAEMKHRIA